MRDNGNRGVNYYRIHLKTGDKIECVSLRKIEYDLINTDTSFIYVFPMQWKTQQVYAFEDCGDIPSSFLDFKTENAKIFVNISDVSYVETLILLSDRELDIKGDLYMHEPKEADDTRYDIDGNIIE